ncbi:restriction endonuclease subunit S [Paenibacillus sp. GYB006]|uniref:restriction endonuclease subunit S n=1 Tax=Paenibacillus sp. GYB006 TaxID=2994394 RepID=UPI002F96C4DB
MISNGWKEVSLEDVVDALGDGLHGTPKYKEEGDYYFINGNNLDGNILISEKTKKVGHEEFLKYKKDLNDRTILVSINGTLGKVAVYNGEKVVLGKSACYFNVKKNYSKQFVKYVMYSKGFKDYLNTHSTGTTIKNMGLKQMRAFKFHIPQLHEQKAIANILSSLDEKIEVNNQINKKLEEMAQAVFKQWFVDFEFPNEEGMPYKSSGGAMVESELGMIPEGWEVGVINDIGIVTGGGTPSKKREDYYTDKGIPWITPKDLSINKNRYINNGVTDITEEGLKNSSAKLMPEGTVLFSSRAPIGYMAIAGNPLSTNQGFKSVIPYSEYGTEFVYQLLSINKNIIENHASGSTFKEISGGVLKQIKILLPSKELIAKFNSVSESFGLTIKNHEEQISKLTMIRDTLLPKLMSGEIRVPIDKE